MIDKGIPRHDYVIKNANGDAIGKVTSGTMSPVLGIGIGLGYVTIEHANAGSEVYIDVRGRALKAAVTKLPFI
jgi:aminomethyltransferase